MSFSGKENPNGGVVVIAERFLKRLNWRKTPGKDEVVADVSAAEHDQIFRAIDHMMELYIDDTLTEVPIQEDDNASSSIDGVRFTGKRVLDLLVNHVGISFKEADEYRTKGRPFP